MLDVTDRAQKVVTKSQVSDCMSLGSFRTPDARGEGTKDVLCVVKADFDFFRAMSFTLLVDGI